MTRGSYRQPANAELERIETKRKRLGVSIETLAGRADLATSSYRRMLKSGLAFARRLTALRHALRSIEAEQKREAELFPERRK